MKRILICAVVALAFAATSMVYATPEIAKKTGKPCSYCHKNPAGGGALTAAGTYYQKNGKLQPAAKTTKPAAKTTKPAAKPAKKTTKKPAAKPSTRAKTGKGPSMAPGTGHRYTKAAAHKRAYAKKHYRTRTYHKRAGMARGHRGK